MKKIFLMIALFSAVVCANAQIATENSNALDNVGVGVTAGVSTPFDFDGVFPVDYTFGLKATKDVTPVFGVQLEGVAMFNSNHFAFGYTAIDAVNINANLSTNLSNAFFGYKGSPRPFEVNAVTGLGWFHTCSAPSNSVVAKTGFDLVLNLGKEKEHSVVVTPNVLWNLSRPGNFKLSNSTALLGVSVSYIYHFKTSNGTRHFKTYDVGAMQSEIENLNGRLAQSKADLDDCLNRKPVVVEKIITQAVNDGWIVEFELNKSDLTANAKKILDTVGNNSVVNIVGTASPEGEVEYNKVLSEKRAAVVADYLTKRGVRVNSFKGIGVQTNRLAIVTVVK